MSADAAPDAGGGAPPVPRPDLDDRLDGWLADAAAPRFFLVCGPPGSGKTTWVRELTASARLAEAGGVWAAHFCREDDVGSTDAIGFLANVSSQFSRANSVFAAALAERAGATFRTEGPSVSVDQHVTNSPNPSVVGVYIKELVFRGGVGIGEAARVAFAAPLAKALAAAGDDASRPWVIVVDALDEAQRDDGTGVITIPRLLTRLGDLPSQVRFVVTSRPERLLEMERAGCRRVDLAEQSGARVAVRAFVSAALARAGLAARVPSSEQAATVDAVCDLAGSNFLVAAQALAALSQGAGQVGPATVARLPGDLPGLYLAFLVRRFGDAGGPGLWQRRYAPFAGALAVAAEPLGEAQLVTLAGGGAGAGEVRARIGELRHFLEPAPTPEGAPGWRIYHRSFADFLLDGSVAEDFVCPEEEQHALILGWARGPSDDWRAVDWRHADPYALRHVVRHLVASRRNSPDLDGLRALLAGSFAATKAVMQGGATMLEEDFRHVVAAARGAGDAQRTLLFGFMLAAWRDRLLKAAAPEAVLILVKLGRMEEALQMMEWLKPDGATQPGDLQDAHANIVRTVAELSGTGEVFAAVDRLADPGERSGLLVVAAEALAGRNPGGSLHLLREAAVAGDPEPSPRLSVCACRLLAAHVGYEDVAFELAVRDRYTAGERRAARAAVITGLAARDVERALILADDLFGSSDVLHEEAGGEFVDVNLNAFRIRVLAAYARADRSNASRAWRLAEELLDQTFSWNFAEGLPLACALARSSPDLGQKAFRRLDRSGKDSFLKNALAAAAVGSHGGPDLLGVLLPDVPEGLPVRRGRLLEPFDVLCEVCVAVARLDLEPVASCPAAVSLLARFAAALLKLLAERDVSGPRLYFPKAKNKAAGVLGHVFGLAGLEPALQFVEFVRDNWRDAGSNAEQKAVAGVVAGLAEAHPEDLVQAMEQDRFTPGKEDYTAVAVVAAGALARRHRGLAIDLVEKIPAMYDGTRRAMAGKVARRLEPEHAGDLLRLLRLINCYAEGEVFALALQEARQGLIAADVDRDPCDLDQVAREAAVRADDGPVRVLIQARRAVDCAALVPAGAPKSAALAAAWHALGSCNPALDATFFGERLEAADLAWKLSLAAVGEDPALALCAAASFWAPHRSRRRGARNRRGFLRKLLRSVLESAPGFREPAEAVRLMEAARARAGVGFHRYAELDLGWAWCAELPPPGSDELLGRICWTDLRVAPTLKEALLVTRSAAAAERALSSEEPPSLGWEVDWRWIRRVATQEWAGRDPARAISFWRVAGQPDGDELLEEIFAHWPQARATEALARLAELELEAGSAPRRRLYNDCCIALATNLAAAAMEDALPAVAAIRSNPWGAARALVDVVVARLRSETSVTTDEALRLASTVDYLVRGHKRAEVFGELLAAPCVLGTPLEPRAVADIIARLALGDPASFFRLTGAMVRCAAAAGATAEAALEQDLGMVHKVLSIP